jgi:hypothetical protein
VRCFGCDLAGDALTLIAEARGLSLTRDFRAVLAEGARLGGLWGAVLELEEPKARKDTRERVHTSTCSPPPSPAEPEPHYPPPAELAALWSACVGVGEVAAARAELERREINPHIVEDLDLARALPDGARLPWWASYRGDAPERRSWLELGYHLVLPVYDDHGSMRSVRAWRVVPGEGPKRLPPSGHKASGLVLADPAARALLAAGRWLDAMDRRVVIVEGEPDFLTWATRFPDSSETIPSVIGLVSGAWTEEIAARIPTGARVVVRTDHDRAGDAYAARVHASLAARCTVLRSKGTT